MSSSLRKRLKIRIEGENKFVFQDYQRGNTVLVPYDYVVELMVFEVPATIRTIRPTYGAYYASGLRTGFPRSLYFIGRASSKPREKTNWMVPSAGPVHHMPWLVIPEDYVFPEDPIKFLDDRKPRITSSHLLSGDHCNVEEYTSIEDEVFKYEDEALMEIAYNGMMAAPDSRAGYASSRRLAEFDYSKPDWKDHHYRFAESVSVRQTLERMRGLVVDSSFMPDWDFAALDKSIVHYDPN